MDILIPAIAAVLGAVLGAVLTSKGESKRNRQNILAEMYSSFFTNLYKYTKQSNFENFTNFMLSAEILRLFCSEEVLNLTVLLIEEITNNPPDKCDEELIENIRIASRKDINGNPRKR